MSSQHKTNPVTFRPPEGDRAWLYAYAEVTGRSAGSILSEALAEFRAWVEAGAIDGTRRTRLAPPPGSCED